MKKWTVLAVIFVLAMTLPMFAQKAAEPAQTAAGTGNLDSYIQVLRSNVRTERMAIIGKAMQFSDTESSVFWPVYRNYELEVGKLNDQRVAIIKDYATHVDDMTPAIAKDLANRSFALEEQRTSLRRKYFTEFEKVMPATRVAKFFQVDHRLDLLVDLQIASEVPLMD